MFLFFWSVGCIWKCCVGFQGASLKGEHRFFCIILICPQPEFSCEDWGSHDHFWPQEGWWSRSIERTWSLVALWSCPSNSRWMISVQAMVTLEFLLFEAESDPNWPSSHYASVTLCSFVFKNTKYNSNAGIFTCCYLCLKYLSLVFVGVRVLFLALAHILPLERSLGLWYWPHHQRDYNLSPTCYSGLLGNIYHSLRLSHLFNLLLSVSLIEYNL